MNRAIAISGITPVIDRTFDFADVRAALEFMKVQLISVK